ncbi:unnamed protein product [Pleuronectes platessa]|uniref:Uncharacterized protein n=1 Tax=Pleuronectes platessa TaxID=8262 RepID=A0A9N7U104_PLEPL|nr:unnamed protein product [Pleuronectes platessa]
MEGLTEAGDQGRADWRATLLTSTGAAGAHTPVLTHAPAQHRSPSSPTASCQSESGPGVRSAHSEEEGERRGPRGGEEQTRGEEKEREKVTAESIKRRKHHGELGGDGTRRRDEETEVGQSEFYTSAPAPQRRDCDPETSSETSADHRDTTTQRDGRKSGRTCT